MRPQYTRLVNFKRKNAFVVLNRTVQSQAKMRIKTSFQSFFKIVTAQTHYAIS